MKIPLLFNLLRSGLLMHFFEGHVSAGAFVKAGRKFLLLLLFFLFAAGSQHAFADGSKDLYPARAKGNRASLYSTNNANANAGSFPFKTRGTHYVYVKAGEYITAASSAVGLRFTKDGIARARAAIVLTRPDGMQFITRNEGSIANRTQELGGPISPAVATNDPNRYKPYSHLVTAAEEGVWRVDMDSPNSTEGGGAPQADGIAADADWTQNLEKEFIVAWDVSVFSGANVVQGRVYASILNLGLNGGFGRDASYYGTNYVLTKDGRAYYVQNNGNNGFGFAFFSNNKGFIDAAGNPTFKSLDVINKNAVQDPRIQDNAAKNLVTHKLFYTRPAADLPSVLTRVNLSDGISAGTATSTWLKNPAIVPAISNVGFTGAEDTPNQASQKGGYITFTANVPGSYRITISINRGTERVLTGSASAGVNKVVWDGKDGAGIVIPEGPLNPVVKVRLTSAEVHFPFVDMEINPKGIIIELTENNTSYTINRASADESVYSDRVYWDDSAINGGDGRKPDPIVNTLNGMPSNRNGHQWGDYDGENGFGGSSFGNDKGLDTYAYILSNEVAVPLSLTVKVADLQITSLISNITTVGVGENVTFTIGVKNDGPSAVVGSKFTFDVPAGFTITNIVKTGCGIESGASNSGLKYQSALDLTNGCEVIYKITGTVARSLLGQPIPVTASILRPNDVTDPNATNTVFTTKPTSAADECIAGTSGSVANCNNIKTNSETAVANPTGTVTGGQSVCAGTAPVAITFTGSGGTAPYTFYYTVNNGTEASISTTSGNTATVTQPTAAGTYVYKLLRVSDMNLTFQNPQSGGGATTTVQVNPAATVDKPANQVVCNAANTTVISFGGSAGNTYSWTNDNTSIGLAPTGNGTISSFVATNITNEPAIAHITVTPTSSLFGCPGIPETFTIIVNPTPTINQPPDQVKCSGTATDAVIFSGAVAGTTYTWTNSTPSIGLPASGTGNINSFIARNTGATSVLATITVTSMIAPSPGSPSSCPGGSASFTIRVNPLPTATISGSTTVCASNTSSPVTFQGTGGVAPYTFSYKIDGGATLLATSDATGKATLTQANTAGTYVYTLLGVKDASSTACDNAQSGTVTIQVNPLPTATISGSTTVCASNTSSPVTFQGTGGTAPYTFSYNIDGGTTLTTVSDATGKATLTQINTAGTYVYTLLSVKDASSTACDNAQSGAVTIQVNPLPTATINGSTTVCASNTSSPVTFQGAGGTAPYTFSYKIDGGATLLATSDATGIAMVPQANTAGTYVYTLLSVKDASSTACDNAQSGAVTIQVNPLPTATINGSTTVCASTTSSPVTFQGTGGTAPYTFSYKIDGGATLLATSDATGKATLTQANIAGTYVYTLLSVKDASSTACDNAQSGAVTIQVNPLPTATINGSTTVCASNTSSPVTFQGTGGTAPYTFSYKIDGGATLTTVSDATGKATLTQANTAGTYVYTLLGVKDASSTACDNAQSGTVTIRVNPNTTLQLTSATVTTNQTICINNNIRTITYQALNATRVTATGLPNGISGTYVNGIFIITGTPSISGTFNYTVTATGNCTSVQLSGTITVNPKPIGYNDIVNNLSCGNTTISYNLQDNVNNITRGGNAIPASFTWTVAPNSNVTGISNGSGARINAALYNLSNTTQQVVYTVTPTSASGSCPGRTFTVTVTLPVCTGLSITKTADVNVVTRAGDPIRYTITVKNTATANQTRVRVTDPFLGGVLAGPASGDNGNGILEANESWIYTGVYHVTQSDIDGYGKPTAGTGKIINTATVNSAEHPGMLSATAAVNIVTEGEITLVKTGVLSSDFSTITYTFKITNTGRVRLSNLKLLDTKIRQAINLNPAVLEAGASVTATVIYTVTDAEKRDGKILNTATVTGTTPSGSTVSDISGTESNNDDPTVHIIDDAPQALNDHAETKINQAVTVDLTVNDLPSYNGLDKGSILISRFPTNGQLQVNANGTVIYTPNRGYSGPDNFTYTVKDLKGSVSNTALVNITVIPIDLFIPNTFTPNGDGKNDTFKIIGRESFDSINLLIFNRWGNEVYRNMNYLDEWDGSGLSEGTYYYIIVLKKGATEATKKGWILLKR